MKQKTPRFGIPGAIHQVAALIGWDEVRRVTGRTTRAVRYWGDQALARSPTLKDALALDVAYLQAGGDVAPLQRAYAAELQKLCIASAPLRELLVSDLATASQEAGEAIAAGLHACQPNATPRELQIAAVEVEQASHAFGAAFRRLQSFVVGGATA